MFKLLKTRNHEQEIVDTNPDIEFAEPTAVQINLPMEKDVIIPVGSDAKGRGSSRRFSARNLFEFVVALSSVSFICQQI